MSSDDSFDGADAAIDAQPTTVASTTAAGPRAKKDIALCLSGGGYRAALFHLGALTRLNELGETTCPPSWARATKSAAHLG